MSELIVATLTIDFSQELREGNQDQDQDQEVDEQGNPIIGSLYLEHLGGYSYVMWIGGVLLIDHQCAGGVISSDGNYSKEVSEYVVFSNTSTSSLPTPAEGDVAWEPVGQAYTVDETNGSLIPSNPGKPRVFSDLITVSLGVKSVAIYQATYRSIGQKFTIISDMPVVVVVAIGRKIGTGVVENENGDG